MLKITDSNISLCLSVELETWPFHWHKAASLFARPELPNTAPISFYQPLQPSGHVLAGLCQRTAAQSSVSMLTWPDDEQRYNYNYPLYPNRVHTHTIIRTLKSYSILPQTPLRAASIEAEKPAVSCNVRPPPLSGERKACDFFECIAAT